MRKSLLLTWAKTILLGKKTFSIFSFTSALALLFTFSSFAAPEKGLVETARHLTRVKILESNNVSLRPGSVYDNSTYFESIAGAKPKFNYEFLDSGLGAAEPLYPMYQRGHQGSWLQLLPAFFSEKARHIDHYTSLVTPDGCKVDGIYMLRHISEYPKTVFVQERQEGYDLVVVRLEYYTRQFPEAQCGKHRANDPDANFDPMAFMKKYHKAMLLTDFPTEPLKHFEAKLSVIRHIYEIRGKNKWPRFDLDNLKNNTLWFYPQGHTPDYGINTPYALPQAGVELVASDLFIEGHKSIEEQFPLSQFLSADEFLTFKNMLNGKPTSTFMASSEPGGDVLDLKQVDSKFYYTSGLEMQPITHASEDVLNLKNYALVGITAKPYEEQTDHSWGDLKKSLPQIRFVYQLRDPQNPQRHFEQMFLHLKFNAVAAEATDAEIETTRVEMLQDLHQIKNSTKGSLAYQNQVTAFLEKFTSRHGLQDLAWSSSLSGIWIFGNLSRSQNIARQLLPTKIIRAGIDLGYYSSSYDNDLFRAFVAKNKEAKPQNLIEEATSILSDITMSFYRDPKRMNVEALTFNRVSCAQCHQTGGRDGVHLSFNDHIDRRITTLTRPSEFLIRDLEAQLKQAAGRTK